MGEQQYKPASVRNRYTGVRQFLAWCLEEGEITETPMRNIGPPPIPDTRRPFRLLATSNRHLTFAHGDRR
jgi:site-specific recombinase XerC